jgi:DNA polymerase-3 subunit gamma/tau
VLAVLGVTDADLLLEACDAVESGDARRALQAVARLSESGRDAAAFARDLEVHARELLVIDTLGEVPPQVALTPDADARRADQARRLGRGAIVRLLDLLAAAMEAIKAGADARTQVELALVKAAAPEVDASLRAVLARLERLESAAGVGAASATASTPVEMPPAPADAPPPPEAAAEPREEALATVAVSVGQTATAVAAAALAVTEPAHAPAEDAPDLDVLTGLWPGVLETIGAENSLLAAVLADARPVGLAGTELRIGFPPSAAFLCRKAEDQANRDAVMRALRALTGHALNVAYTLREDDPAEVEAGSPPPSEEEWIARFKAEFDAEELVDPSEEEGAPEDPARPVAARQEGEAP